jgi:hypothetical protein
MNRLSMIILLGIWVLPISLFSTSTHAVSQSKSRSIGDNQAPLNTIALLYKNGLIDANINDVSIRKILDELKVKTGTRISIYDPSIANSRVSATLKGIPLDKTIQIILEGFSYALYPLDDIYVVIVLSTDPKMVRTNRRVTSELKTTAQPKNLSNATEEVEAQSVADDANNETVPKSLDKFQPITMEEHWLDHVVEESTEDSEQLTIERRYQEALIQRAHDAINSEHEHLYKEALNQLVGINDPRATEMLIDATRTETDWISRAQAVDALWQHAVNLQFSDDASINALKQLVGDSDESVNSIARRALLDIQSATAGDVQ